MDPEGQEPQDGQEMDWLLNPWLLTAVALLDVVAILRVLLRAHGIESSLTWILGILTFPGLGALTYLAFAHPRIEPTTRRKQLASRSLRGRRAPSGSGDPPGPGAGGEAPVLERSMLALTELPATAGNSVELMADSESAFAAIEAALSSAQHSLWVEFYIVRNDSTGVRILQLLAERARAGVDVRLLYDGVGSFQLGGKALRDLRAAGARTEVFLPLNPLRRRWSIHLRNHRKLVVVDGEVVFTGGMNLGDEYSGRSRLRGQQHFHDTHLRMEGPASRDLALVFAEDWLFSTGEALELPGEDGRCMEHAGPARASVVPSGPDQRLNASRLLYFGAIGSARKRLWLTSPYFVPDPATRMALIAAAVRGVDVRLLLPARSDVRLVGLAARAFYEELLRAGLRIHEFEPSMLHAKTLLVDDSTCVVGSSNVDMRSFRWNFELSVLVDCEQLAAQLEQRFESDLEESREVALADVEKLNIIQRLGRGAASLLSPLL